ncbi:hypothetical protein QYF36_018061 [Acer negundo]|nr:hypothetical protein QYF36_018061 [Acer negundo]
MTKFEVVRDSALRIHQNSTPCRRHHQTACRSFRRRRTQFTSADKEPVALTALIKIISGHGRSPLRPPLPAGESPSSCPGRTGSDGRLRERVGQEVRGGDQVVVASKKAKLRV